MIDHLLLSSEFTIFFWELLVWVWIESLCLTFAFFLFFIFIQNNVFTWVLVCQWVSCTEFWSISGSRALHTGPITSLTGQISGGQCTPVGHVHCSRDSQISFFNNFFIINESHGTIHTFKNYFDTVFSVFSFSNNKFNPNGSNI